MSTRDQDQGKLLVAANRIASPPSVRQNGLSFSKENLRRIVADVGQRNPQFRSLTVGVISVLGSNEKDIRTIYTDLLIHYYSRGQDKDAISSWHNIFRQDEVKMKHVTASSSSSLHEDGVYIWPLPYIVERATKSRGTTKPEMLLWIAYVLNAKNSKELKNFCFNISSAVVTFRESEKTADGGKDFVIPTVVNASEAVTLTRTLSREAIMKSWEELFTEIEKIKMLPLMHMGKHVKLDTFIGYMETIPDRVNLREEPKSTQQLEIRANDVTAKPKLQQQSSQHRPDVPLQGNRYEPGRIGSSAASMPRTGAYNRPNPIYSQQIATSDSDYPISERLIKHSKESKLPIRRSADGIGPRSFIGHNRNDGIPSREVNNLSLKSATKPIAKISEPSKVTSQIPATFKIFSKQEHHPLPAREHGQSQSKSAPNSSNKNWVYTPKSSDPKPASERKPLGPKPVVIPPPFQHLQINCKSGVKAKVLEAHNILPQVPHRSSISVNNHKNDERLDKQNLDTSNNGMLRPTGNIVAYIRARFQQNGADGHIVYNSKESIKWDTQLPVLKHVPNAHLNSVHLVKQASKSTGHNASTNSDSKQSPKNILTPWKANHNIDHRGTPYGIHNQKEATPPPPPKHTSVRRPGAAERFHSEKFEVHNTDKKYTDGNNNINNSSPNGIQKVWQSKRIGNDNPFIRQIRTQGNTRSQYTASADGSNRSLTSKDTVIQMDQNTIPPADTSGQRYQEAMYNSTISLSQLSKNDEKIKFVSEATTGDNSAVWDAANMGLDNLDGSKYDSPIHDPKITDTQTQPIPVQCPHQETNSRATAVLSINVPGDVNSKYLDINGNKTMHGNDLQNSATSKDDAMHKSSTDDSFGIKGQDKDKMIPRHSEPPQTNKNVEAASNTHTSNHAASPKTDAVPTLSDVTHNGTNDNGNSPGKNKILHRPKLSIKVDPLEAQTKRLADSKEHSTVLIDGSNNNGQPHSESTETAAAVQKSQHSVADSEEFLQDNSESDNKLPMAVSNIETQAKPYKPINDHALSEPSDIEYGSLTNDELFIKISPLPERGADTTTPSSWELHSELHSTNKASGISALPVDHTNSFNSDSGSSVSDSSNVQTEESGNSDQDDVPKASSLTLSKSCRNEGTRVVDEAAINPSDNEMRSSETKTTEQSVVDAGEHLNLPNSEENCQVLEDAHQHESGGQSPGRTPGISDGSAGSDADNNQNADAGFIAPPIETDANHVQSTESDRVDENTNRDVSHDVSGPTNRIHPAAATLTSAYPDPRSEFFIQPVLETDPKIIEQNVISKLLLWVKDHLHIINVELMLENVDASSSNATLAEQLLKFQDIVKGVNVDLRNMFDNYVCFDGERDRNQMERFIQTAVKRASERWGSSGLNGTCFTLDTVETAYERLVKIYRQHNDKIVEAERQQIQNLISKLSRQYESSLQSYMQVGIDKLTRDELENIHRRMRNQCVLIVSRSMKYGGKLNNIMREATIQMTKSLNDYFEQQIKSHVLHTNIHTFSDEQGYQDRKQMYLKFMTEQKEPQLSIAPTDWKQKHDVVVDRVTKGLSRTEEEELQLLLDTRFLYVMEDYEYKNKSIPGPNLANILGLHLTSHWVYVLAYTPELGCKRLTFPGPNGRIPKLPALMASAGEYFSWGYEAFKVITEQKDRLDQHGYLVHCITRDTVGAIDDHDLVKKFIHETTAAVERGVKAHFDGVVLVVPSWFTFEHRHRVRECCHDVGLQKVIILTDTSLIVFQAFKALPRHDERSESPLIAVVSACNDAVQIEIFEGVSSGDEMISARLLAVASEGWSLCEDNGGYSSLKHLTSNCLETVKATYGRVLAQVQMNQRQSICYYAVNSERSDWETSLDDFLTGEEKLTKVEPTGDLFSEIFSSFCTDPSKLSKFLGVMATSILNDTKSDDDDSQMQIDDNVDEEFSRRKKLLLEKCDNMETQITEGVVSMGRLTQKIIMEAIRMGRLAAEEDMIEGAEAREVEELFQLHNFN